MTATPATQNYLSQYVTERLPALQSGAFENPEDLPAFTEDRRYAPLQQLPYPV